jgi:hypothetical protein
MTLNAASKSPFVPKSFDSRAFGRKKEMLRTALPGSNVPRSNVVWREKKSSRHLCNNNDHKAHYWPRGQDLLTATRPITIVFTINPVTLFANPYGKLRTGGYSPQIASKIFLSHSPNAFGFDSLLRNRLRSNQVAYRPIASATAAPPTTHISSRSISSTLPH